MINLIIGYARVSTQDQNLIAQIEAIEEYAQGSRLELFRERESGAKAERKELKKALDYLSQGDIFVVYKIDRLARSTKQLTGIIELIEEKGAHFVSLQNKGMDTTDPTGRLLFTILGGVAEFERQIILERTRAGLASAKKRGIVGGRPSISDKIKRKVVTAFNAGESASQIAEDYEIGRSTVYKILNDKKS